MYHIIRWTPEKIKQRLDLIAPLVYIQRHNLPSFRYKELAGPNTPPPIGLHIDDAAWEQISANLSVDQDSILLNIKPYQIVTLRVKFK